MPDGFSFDGTHEGYTHLAGAPRHQRKMCLSGQRISISDAVHGGNGQCVEASFLICPEGQVTLIEGGAEIFVAGHRVLTLKSSSSVRVDSAVFFPDFGLMQNTSRIIVIYGEAPCVGEIELEF